MKDIIADILHNKNNNQLMITLSRKKLKLNKEEIPKKIRLKIEEVF